MNAGDDDDDDDDEIFIMVLVAFSSLLQCLSLLTSVLKNDTQEYDDSYCDDEGPPRKKKRRFLGRTIVNYDRERTRQATQHDYLGPRRIFDDKQFQRVFRITRGCYDRIRAIVASQDDFFTDGYMPYGRVQRKISVDAKLLSALKHLGYGVTVNAFRDYFQMGESTMLKCVDKFVTCLINSDELRNTYLRKMTPSDARRVTSLHKQVQGVSGMAGSLDCTHFYWKNCPMELQGQFTGKEGDPTITMESTADYNLWIWNAKVGYAGTLNDLNIWDMSNLNKDMLDGTFAKLDYEYEIGGEKFDLLYFLVDGIYPPVARFVQSFSVPQDLGMNVFSKWQEAARKDVERSYGILKRKFHVLSRPCERWNLHDMISLTYACIILHNMMVEVRIENGERESDDMYECLPVPGEENEMAILNNRREGGLTVALETEDDIINDRYQHYLQLRADGNLVTDEVLMNRRRRLELRPHEQRMAMGRWQQLNNPDEFVRLRNAIIRELLEKREENQ